MEIITAIIVPFNKISFIVSLLILLSLVNMNRFQEMVINIRLNLCQQIFLVLVWFAIDYK